MAKEPWEEDIYDNGEKDLKRTKKSSDVLAGISIAELERLNPSHMTTGSWYANPGDVVKTR